MTLRDLTRLADLPCLVAGKGNDDTVTRGTIVDAKESYGTLRLAVRREGLRVRREGTHPNAVYTYGLEDVTAWVEASRVYVFTQDGAIVPAIEARY